MIKTILEALKKLLWLVSVFWKATTKCDIKTFSKRHREMRGKTLSEYFRKVSSFGFYFPKLQKRINNMNLVLVSVVTCKGALIMEEVDNDAYTILFCFL